jgi:hypothetical protein
MGILLLMTASVSALADNTRNNKSNPSLQASSGIHGLEHARQRSDGAWVAKGRVSGTGEIHAGHVVIEGVLSPGNSPGCINFGGNVTFSFSATLITEIGGLVPCTEHDQINVGNVLTINNATFEIILINGFVPQFGDTFNAMNWGSITGTFGTIDSSAALLPAPLLWDTSQLYVTGELTVGVQQFSDGDLAPWDNPDGVINAADVLIANQLALGSRTPGALQYAHGDMNIDGVIDIADQLLITRVVLGLF